MRGISASGAAVQMGMDVGDTLVSAALIRGGERVYSLAVTRLDVLGELLYAVRLGDTLELTVSRRGEAQTFSYTFSDTADFTEVN